MSNNIATTAASMPSNDDHHCDDPQQQYPLLKEAIALGISKCGFPGISLSIRVGGGGGGGGGGKGSQGSVISDNFISRKSGAALKDDDSKVGGGEGGAENGAIRDDDATTTAWSSYAERVTKVLLKAVTNNLRFPRIPFSIGNVSGRKRGCRETLIKDDNDCRGGSDDDLGKPLVSSWSYAAGYSCLESQTKMDSNFHSFCIGSITKTLIAVIVLQLVEEHLLDLNQTIMYYFEKDHHGSDGTTSEGKKEDDDDDDDESDDENHHGETTAATTTRGLLKRIDNTNKATIRHLLSHQSGIRTWEFQLGWIRDGRGRRCKGSKLFTKLETLHYVTDLPATHGDPGSQYSYSNTNYTLLGLLIEHVTGNDVSIEINNRILNPLNIPKQRAYLDSFPDKNSDDDDDDDDDDSADIEAAATTKLSDHYHYASSDFTKIAGLSKECHIPVMMPVEDDDKGEENDDDEIKIVNTSNANFSCEWTAGGMIVTMPDLCHYGHALLRDAKHLLKTDEMRRELYKYRPPKSDIIAQSSSGGSDQKLTDSSGRYSQGICRTVAKIKRLKLGKEGGDVDDDDDDDEESDEKKPKKIKMSEEEQAYVAGKEKKGSEEDAKRDADDNVMVEYYGHGGLTLGFCSRLAYLSKQDIVIAVATNIGIMHCGFEENHSEGKSPWDIFFEDILLPAIVATFEEKEKPWSRLKRG